MKFKAVLFDLDGTLLDTLEDLADATNSALETYGFATHPLDKYRIFVGDGAIDLARRVLPKDHRDEQTIKKILDTLLDNYSNCWADKTRPYPGIEQMLTDLEQAGIPTAIFTNKPDNFTQLVVNKLLGGFSFKIVRGLNESTPKKPDPTAALEIAEQLGVEPQDTLYVGDTNTDMQTAVAADMFPLGVLWGFRDAEELTANGAKALIETPDQILKHLSIV